ncbi:MAG TPA: four helix bundle protein [Candidatus Sulfotelmatobacter sp.]|nr:four helix bundle protein [Candidatus Sulfotelmatobacter sp.]
MRKPHKKLDLWKLSMDHAVQVYKVTERFPQEERYGITGQIRRAGISIPSNIAEGAARQTRKEFVNYLHMAQGSLSEMDTLLELAKRLEFLPLEDWNTLDNDMERMDKMLSGLIRHQKRLQVTPGRTRP